MYTDPAPRPPRPAVYERAARRDRVTRSGDRYTSLLRVLRAGREMPVEPRRNGWMRRVAASGNEVWLAFLGAAGSLVALAAWYRLT